ncbi:DUF3802 family protein [Psychrosphaera haliotis]|uniref:DUF3802 family protein n=1 Tax=Psychrosphaera haliotis TaxID=555083 RepID=A0A6N8FC28_9GAMM|nr:DUF3802 family protein [Psychrosphaera haliotis]MUH73089.1 DUF3802 family protein [Psychrosphaera haliotis]
MVTDKAAYIELMNYLTSSKEVFLTSTSEQTLDETLEVLVENEIATQIINLCSQHDDLETNHRSIIVREVDGIVYDMQQVLADYWHQNVTPSQVEFITEFTSLIKNVFDSAIADLLD